MERCQQTFWKTGDYSFWLGILQLIISNLVSDDYDDNPLLPLLALHRQREDLGYALFDSHPTDVEDALISYFSFSMASRLHRQVNYSFERQQSVQHPLAMFEYVKTEELAACIPLMDNQILNILFDNKDPKLGGVHLMPLEEYGSIENLKKMRSAIEFFEEEIVPHCEEAQESWKRFREGDGMTELEKVLENPVGSGKTVDLRVLPDSHTWFTKEDREKSEKVYGKVPGETH